MKKLFKPFMFLMIPLVSLLVVSCHDEEIVEEPVVVAPAISAVSPEQARVGTEITITGTDLKEVSSVKFGEVDAEGFDAATNTSTTIKATVPAAAVVGAQKILISSPGGTAEFTFTVLEEEQPEPVPTITGISPEEGRAGSEVIISGTNLAGTTELTFGELALSGYTAAEESITFTVPEEAVPGAVTITVTTPGGEASTDFTVLAPLPAISSFNPASRVVGGEVTVTGSHLNLITAVYVGETQVAEFTPAEDGTTLTFTVPMGALTAKIILVTESGEEVESEGTLTVEAPAPFVFSPMAGPIGTEVTITGADFTGTSAIMVGSVEITEINVAEDGSSIVFTVPATVTAGKITVGELVSTKNFIVVEESLLADFDVNTMLKWPQNGNSDWGWGIPDENITNTAEGIQPIDGYFALINMDIAPNRAWANEKVVNLVSWSGYQIYPEAPAATYDPAAPASDFVIRMDIAVAQPLSLDGLVLTLVTFNANGTRIFTDVNLADFVGTADGSWKELRVPLNNLAGTAGYTYSTYGDLLAGGLPLSSGSDEIVHHFRIELNNLNAEGTDPIAATLAIDNIQIVKVQ